MPETLTLLLLTLAGLLLWRWFLFRGPVIPPSQLPSGRVVDLHCHCAGIGAGGSHAFVSPGMRSSWKYRWYMRGFQLTESDLKRRGDRFSIDSIARQIAEARRVDGAVVLAMDLVVGEDGQPDPDHTLFYIPNRWLARETSRYPHLYFGASVHPYRRDALQRLEWCAAQDARLLKWLPSIQHIDPAQPRLKAFYRKLVELNLPLLSHAGDERSFTHARDELADPARLRLPLELGVTVIAAHIGSTGKNEGQDNMERTLALMEEFPNLWADISALTQINRKRFLQRGLEAPGIHVRLLYGSDYPLINMALVSPYYFPLRLSWKQMRSIARIRNPWDRDVALKQALGVPGEVFTRPAELLKIG